MFCDCIYFYFNRVCQITKNPKKENEIWLTPYLFLQLVLGYIVYIIYPKSDISEAKPLRCNNVRFKI